MLVFVAAFTACKKDLTDPASDATSSNSTLPLKATVYVENNYPDAEINYYVAVSNSPAAFLVTLTTAEELAFSSKGDYLGHGANYHGGTHSDTIPCHHGGHGGGIPVDSLPAAIQEYVTANYPDYEIRHAGYDSLCAEGLVIDVMLFQAELEPVKLVFTTEGDFLMRSDRILYSTLPQAIQDYITTNYSGYTPSDKSEQLSLESGDLNYVAFVRQDSIKTSLRFDGLGQWVCEQSGYHHGGHGGAHGGGHGGGHGGHGGGHNGGIPIDSLPVAITTYISANYADYTIEHAHYDSICVTGLSIRVKIEKEGSDPIDLYFDSSNQFVMNAVQISEEEIPQVVLDFVSANYADFHLGKTDLLTFPDASLQYRIDLFKQHEKKRITIDSSGVLVCEL